MEDNPVKIAFLRAINVGGHVVKMDQLRDLLESVGMLNVKTFLASGNVIFESPKEMTNDVLTSVIENRLQVELGYRVATFLRNPEALKEVAETHPFLPEEMAAAAANNIGFLKETPAESLIKKLLDLQTDIDRLHVQGREVYWSCLVKQSESTLSNAAFEKALGMECTLRGINTVRRIAAMVST